MRLKCFSMCLLLIIIQFSMIKAQKKTKVQKNVTKNERPCEGYQKKVDSLIRVIISTKAHLIAIEKENERLRDSLFYYILPNKTFKDTFHVTK